jgi:hypothetical protein
MVSGKLLSGILIFCSLSTPTYAQLDAHHRSLEEKVLDLVFPTDGETKPYYVKLVLRFGDTYSQFVVVFHPGGESEVIRYSLEKMGEGELSQLISKMVAANPGVSEKEIADKLKVKVHRSHLDEKSLDRELHRLEEIQISPILETRVAVDEYSEFEYWFDAGQESVHYTIVGPFKDSPQDKLVQWMLKFRENHPD